MSRCSASPGQRGFTLLEVLVALVIIGLGMIAVFGQLNQTLTAATLLRDKTLAGWIATDRITELRLSGEFPGVGDRSDELEMAGQRWRYTLTFADFGLPDRRRVDVSVSLAENPDRELVRLTSIIAKPAGGGIVTGAEFPLLDPNASLTQGELQ